MTRITWRHGRITALALGAALMLAACSGVDEKTSEAGPKGEAFYVAPQDLSSYAAGDLIWSRDYEGPHAIDGAKNSLVLYAQQAHDGAGLVGVSGIVSVPEGTAPSGGWPVISWGNGSRGMADRCALSRDESESSGDLVNEQFVSEWIDKGYAVVRSDYEGLGTPGNHPYLIGPSAGRSMLGIVSAARELESSLSDNVVLVGHSQGGHAALWGASMAESARDLNIKGVVAFAPPSHLAGALEAVIGGMANAPSGMIAVVLRGLEIGHPSDVDPTTVLLPAGLEKYSKIDDACFGELFEPELFGNLPVDEFGNQKADMTVVKGKLNANDPAFRTIKVPILVAQGSLDATVPSIMTNFLAEEYEHKGFNFEYLTYPKADHSSVLIESKAPANEFIDRAFGGLK